MFHLWLTHKLGQNGYAVISCGHERVMHGRVFISQSCHRRGSLKYSFKTAVSNACTCTHRPPAGTWQDPGWSWLRPPAAVWPTARRCWTRQRRAPTSSRRRSSDAPTGEACSWGRNPRPARPCGGLGEGRVGGGRGLHVDYRHYCLLNAH